ncbi:hypothetical protein HQN90_12925 [Paenibacillus alba]|uniref:hypothetical protein n=1 Tax=Paenibacillus alba TaxID=1197127 RepID=UPI0015661D6F|nr:hypothetical protein [Paenibacillus alba]NQX67016.1 hypothetical protein [Paenibacillus alba]
MSNKQSKLAYASKTGAIRTNKQFPLFRCLICLLNPVRRLERTKAGFPGWKPAFHDVMPMACSVVSQPCHLNDFT